jgi:hypothetical protein
MTMRRVGILLLILALLPTGARGQAAGAAMAGHYALLARGVEAPSWNPAVLAWNDRLQIQWLSLEAVAANNSFTWDDYTRWNGAFWTEEDKEAILARIPGSTLEAGGWGSLGAPGVARGPWAVTLASHASGRLGIPKEAARLLFYGNVPQETFSLDDAFGDGLAWTALRASHARILGRYRSWEVAGGLTLKFLQGWAYGEIRRASGRLVTTEEFLEGHAELEELTATLGRGFAVDLGVAAEGPGGWRVGLAVRDLLGSLRWTGSPTLHRQVVDADSVTLDAAEADTDLILTESEDRSVGGFRRSLAPVLLLSAARSWDRWQVEADLVQGLAERGRVTTRPEVGLGASYAAWPFLTLRAGISLGGWEGPVLAGGLGIHPWQPLTLELAFRTSGSLNPFSGKGLGLGFALGTY